MDLPTIAKNYGFFISAGAVLGSAAIAGAVALLNIRTNRELGRKTTTRRLIHDKEEKPHYTELQEKFWTLLPKGELTSERTAFIDRLPALAHDHADYPSTRALDDYLNHYEIIAIGIQARILDKDFYAAWMKSAYVDTWDRAFPYIRACRNAGFLKTYVNFEMLAREWGAKTRL